MAVDRKALAQADGSVPRAVHERFPDFFIVGHAKSGTTALYEMLKRHPQIFMPEWKEPWFFASDMRPRFQPRASGVVPRTVEEYLSLFAGASPEQKIGEASSSYLWSRTAASAIAQAQPAAKIVAILREPASFLRSLHQQLLQSHVEEKRDLRTALSLERARREGKQVPRRSHRPQLLQYAEHVRYTEQLARYRDLFAPEQMLVLIYDDFRADNEGAVRAVLWLLEVDEDHPIEALEVNTTSRTMRSQRLDDVVYSVSVGQGRASRAAKTAIKALTPRGLRRDALITARRRIVQSAPPPEDRELTLELRRRFKGEVEALSEYLGRDLVALWGYDRLD